MGEAMRPYVVINCAMSADGKIALPSRLQTRISDEEDMRRVHKLRSESDAILVGIGTILADNPSLTVKEKYVKGSRNPIRVILDSQGRTPEKAKVLDGRAKTIIATSSKCNKIFPNAEVIRCGKDYVDLRKLMRVLYSQGVRKLLVEGGETVIWSFLKEGLADELKIFVGSMVIGGKVSPTLAGGKGAKSLEEIIPLKLERVRRLGEGVLLEYLVLR